MNQESVYHKLEVGLVAESRGGGCQKRVNRTLKPFFCLLLVCNFTLYSPSLAEHTNQMLLPTSFPDCSKSKMNEMNESTIFVITPTFPRPERFADFTRLTQTLMHISNLIWIVIEDGNQTVNSVERMLNRSGIKHVYLHTIDKQKLPGRGYAQRNYALEYIRKNYANHKNGGVIYFADDDNSYDIRLFNDFIRNVSTIGVWAVGLAGGAKVEAPHVENGVIKKWDVIYNSNRTYAIDMAGFAVNLNLILKSKATFGRQCTTDPENCFLVQLKYPPHLAVPFGWDTKPLEVLVWHTKTAQLPALGPSYGYEFEKVRPKRQQMFRKPYNF